MRRCISFILVFALLMTTVGNAFAQSIKLPTKLNIVGEEAFFGDTSIDEVVVPYGTTEIRSKAFACSGIKMIYIPDTVEYIAEDAFAGVEELTIYSPAECYAQTYAEEHGHAWQDAGNRYQLDQFKATQELYENLEAGEEGAMELEGKLNMESVSVEGITDEETLKMLEEYNALQAESQSLLDDYTASLNEMMDAYWALGESMEDISVEYTDNGMNYSGSGFSFFVGSEGAENLSDDYEILSVEASENGVITLQVRSGGKTFVVEGDMNGINVSGVDLTLTADSLRSRTFVSYDIKGASGSEGSASVFQKIIDQVSWIKAGLNSLDAAVKESSKKADALANIKQAKLNVIRDLLSNPGTMSEDTYKLLQAQAAVAKADYDLVVKVAKTWNKILSVLKTINPVLSISVIVNDFQKWNELGEIYKHGHPLEWEQKDPETRAMVQEMLDNCRAARAAYLCDALTTCLGLVDEVSTLIAMIATATGAGAPAGWLQKAAVTVGVQAIRKLVVSLLAGVFFTVSGTITYNNVMRIDKQLHASVSGCVFDALTNQPIAQVTVLYNEMSTETDENGYFELTLPTGTHTLTFTKTGYSDEKLTIEVDGGSYTSYPIRMKPKVLLTGTVTDAETHLPIIGATVDYGNYRTTTNENGVYSFYVEPGSETLTFSMTGYKGKSMTVECKQGQTTVLDAELMPIHATVLTGTVTDAETGKPLSGATVVYGGRSTTTDANGTYEFRDIAAGTATISFSKSDYISDSFQITCVDSKTTLCNGVLSKKLPNDMYRAVLTWNGAPANLDLVFRIFVEDMDNPSTGAMGVYVDSKNPTTERAWMNSVCASGYGPETLTFYINPKGWYECYVVAYAGDWDYNYSNLPGGHWAYGSLENSGARVRVYKGDKLIQMISLPRPANESDRGIGNVFTFYDGKMDVDGLDN